MRARDALQELHHEDLAPVLGEARGLGREGGPSTIPAGPSTCFMSFFF